MNVSKSPWVAAVLALVLGGPGCFYLGWREGVKATLAWLFVLFFLWTYPNVGEAAVFCVPPLHLLLALMASRSCRRLNAERSGAIASASISVTGAPRDAARTPLTVSKPAKRGSSKVVRAIGAAFALLLVLPFAQIFLTSAHCLKLQRSLHPGMTIADVLHTANENGVLTGRSQSVQPDGALELGKGTTLSGPYDGRYTVLADGFRTVSEADAVRLLQQNMIPGCDYQILFTFTPPTVGPHFSFTVVFNPDGRVKEVQPPRNWD